MGLIQTLTGREKVQIIDRKGTIFAIDCTKKEKHDRKSEPTKFPVEDGTNISDHIILEPFKLEIEGIISDTPISIVRGLITAGASAIGNVVGVAGVALFNSLSSSGKPSVAAYLQLLEIQKNRKAISVLTSLKKYKNMYVSNVSAPRDNETGDALNFTVSFEEIIIVRPKTINIQQFKVEDVSAEESDQGSQESELVRQFKKGQALSKKVAGVGP